jgi:penicillin V acylase-like amidase (Ntn superfamily)
MIDRIHNAGLSASHPRVSAICALLLLSCLAGIAPTHACTAYLLESGEDRAVCRNYDFSTGEAMLLVNPRGLGKQGLVPRNQAHWVARYGSLTLNQFGREVPLEGMNEAGLVVATLWLEETVLSADTTRPGLSSLQWVQYMLDQAGTVKEALALDSTVTVAAGAGSTVHFFLADPKGGWAVVEFLDGRSVHHTGGELPVRAISNDTYENSMRFLQGLKPFGGSGDVPTDMSSLARFARAARYQQRFAAAAGLSLVDFGFASLASVSSGMATQWSVVYDLGARRVWLRTQRKQQLRSVDLASLDFDPQRPARMLAIDDGTGELQASFVPYTTQANRELIFRTFGQVDFLAGVPAEAKETLARFPESLRVPSAAGSR